MGIGSILSTLQHRKLLNNGSPSLNIFRCNRWVASAFMSRIQLKFAPSSVKLPILTMTQKGKRGKGRDEHKQKPWKVGCAHFPGLLQERPVCLALGQL